MPKKNKIELCKTEDIPNGACKGFSTDLDANTQDIFIVNRDNKFYGYKNSCPHTGVNLNWQPDVFMDFDDFYIQCAVHGARFEVESGLCVWGPCNGLYLEEIKLEINNSKIALVSACNNN